MHPAPRLLAWLPLSAVLACAAPAAEGPGLALIVTSTEPWASAADFGQRVAAVAGVPVRGVSAISTRHFALTLDCADETICQPALQRLREASPLVREVERDELRRIPQPPALPAR